MNDVMSGQTRSATKRGFYIEVGCPGCGGELELDDDFWVIRCKYCDSVLRVSMPGTSVAEMTGTHSKLWGTLGRQFIKSGFSSPPAADPRNPTYSPALRESQLRQMRTSAAHTSGPDAPPAFLVKGRVSQYEVRFAIDRYLKGRGEPLTSSEIHYKQVYYPYWKVDAVLLKTRNRIEVIREVREDGEGATQEYERKTRKTEVSLTPYNITFPAGGVIDGVPHSVGMRATYLKGKPFADEVMQEGYRVLPVTVDWARAREVAIKTVGNVGRIETADFGKNRTEMFRPRGTLVYFPYWIAECYGGEGFRRWIVDAVTGSVVGQAEKLTAGEVVDEAAIEFGKLAVGFHRCGNCGHDLPEEQSYVYICRHCSMMTQVEEHPLFAGEVSVAEGGGKDDVYLPFWLLDMKDELATRMKVLAGGMGRIGTLAVPAFRMSNYEAGYRLGRRMTTAVGSFGLRPVGEEKGWFAPVGVGPSEGLVLARVAVAREVLGQSSSLELPSGDAFTGIRLFWAPFHKEHYFYIDSVTNAVAVEKHLVPSE